MKVTICFEDTRLVVPCGDGSSRVLDLMKQAMLRYKKMTGISDDALKINNLLSSDGSLLFPEDKLCDVVNDREWIWADCASTSDVTPLSSNSSSQNHRTKDTNSVMKRTYTKYFDTMVTHSLDSLREEFREEEERQKVVQKDDEIQDIFIRNEIGPLGMYLTPRYDRRGNRELKVERLEPNGRIAKDGRINVHDCIIAINDHNLLQFEFSQIKETLKIHADKPCIKISMKKSKINIKKVENEDVLKKLGCLNYNQMKIANTRKIGRLIEVDVIKRINGFGFSLTSRAIPMGKTSPIYIKNVLNMVAFKNGRLRAGDRLIRFNNVDIDGKSQQDVVSMLKAIPVGEEVKLLVSRAEENYFKNLSVSSVSSDDKENEPTTKTENYHSSEKVQTTDANGIEENEANVKNKILPKSAHLPGNPAEDNLMQCTDNKLSAENCSSETNDDTIIAKELGQEEELESTLLEKSEDSNNSEHSFSRDDLNRKSILEKKRITLDAKSTNTYKKNKLVDPKKQYLKEIKENKACEEESNSSRFAQTIPRRKNKKDFYRTQWYVNNNDEVNCGDLEGKISKSNEDFLKCNLHNNEKKKKGIIAMLLRPFSIS